MRPYHAGLLGADTVVVLDETHLVPPFENLLAAIDSDAPHIRARDERVLAVVPSFKLMSLSATGRTRDGTVFRLDERSGDLDDQVVKQRLSAKKRLTIVDAPGEKVEDALVDQAWSLCDDGIAALRVLVFCDSREVARTVKGGIQKKAASNGIDVEEPKLFVGARRVKERMNVAEHLGTLGFIAGCDVTLQKPSILIVTSAGEVGVDLDADHMVCDIVAWEREVQRLGRVNRRGNAHTKVIVVRPPLRQEEKEALDKRDRNEALSEKERKLLDESEERSGAWCRLLEPFYALPSIEQGYDVSPGALRTLKMRAENDSSLQTKLDAATSSMPLYPALSRPLVEAWIT